MSDPSVLYELFGVEGVGQLEKLACEMLQKEAGVAAILQGLKAGAGRVGSAAGKGGSRFWELLSGAKVKRLGTHLNPHRGPPGVPIPPGQLALAGERLKRALLIAGLGTAGMAAGGASYLALRKKPEEE